MLCDNLIDTEWVAGSEELQGIGASDVSERAGTTVYVLFVDERKGSTVVFENMGTESLSGEIGVVFEDAGNINYRF